MIDLKDLSSQLKDFFERTAQDAETFLDKHAPGLADVAEKLESDPFVQIALDDTIPAELRPVLAKLAKEFIDAYASKPAATPAEGVAPAEPAPSDPATPAV